MASPCGEAVERSETDEGNNLANYGHFLTFQCGPLIRPFGAPSPQGEGMSKINYKFKFPIIDILFLKCYTIPVESTLRR